MAEPVVDTQGRKFLGGWGGEVAEDPHLPKVEVAEDGDVSQPARTRKSSADAGKTSATGGESGQQERSG